MDFTSLAWFRTRPYLRCGVLFFTQLARNDRIGDRRERRRVERVERVERDPHGRHVKVWKRSRAVV
jgi:hypothetical protein